MRYAYHLIKIYPLSCCLFIAIWVLCLIPVPQTPLSHVTLIDKWVHILLYAITCAVVWAEYLKAHQKINKRRLFIGVWVAPVLMSALIELVQATCTGGNRSGDWVDVAANIVGATIGSLIGIVLAKCLSNNKKD